MQLQWEAALNQRGAWERCHILPPLARSLAERAVNRAVRECGVEYRSHALDPGTEPSGPSAEALGAIHD